jgi:hypothetical protein
MTATSELISEYLAGGRIDIELEMDADRRLRSSTLPRDGGGLCAD